MNLLKASRQWAERPEDERFFTLTEMRDACQAYFQSAREASAKIKSFRLIETEGDDLAIVGATGTRARFTHWAYGQFCQRLGAPTDFMRRLPADIAQQALNHQLAQQSDREMQLLFHQNGDLV